LSRKTFNFSYLSAGANIFAQKSLAELTSQVALLRNVLTTRNPNVMITPRYLTCNETMDIVVEAEVIFGPLFVTVFMSSNQTHKFAEIWGLLYSEKTKNDLIDCIRKALLTGSQTFS